MVMVTLVTVMLMKMNANKSMVNYDDDTVGGHDDDDDDGNKDDECDADENDGGPTGQVPGRWCG